MNSCVNVDSKPPNWGVTSAKENFTLPMLSGTKQKERLHRDLACALCRCSLRKKPTFGDATTGFPAKWRLRNEGRNSLLMTRHYPDLGSASDWLNQISHTARPIRSTNQIWVVTRQQCGISALVSNSQTSFGGETRGSVAKCRLFSQARIILVKKLKHYIWGTACRKRKCLEYYN